MAVNRRQKENDTFSDIALTLPIEENAKELDKASILRIAIHYLRLRDVLADCEPDPPEDENLSSVPNFSKDVLQALDGFMLLISRDGKVLFATESIAQYLGLRQVDVIGIDLQDIIHPQDFMDVATIFQSQGRDAGPDMEALGNNHLRRNFVVRMRCAFTPSVRSVTRCSNFKPIYCSAFLKFSNKKVKDGQFLGMVALCKLASVMKVRELCVGAYFKTKHALDLSYTAVDTRIRWILGFDPARMVGLKAYDYFHPQDLLATSSCHTNLLTQGHSHSPCYRFMTQSGDWVWVRSKSCVTYDAISHRPNGLSIYTWIVRYDEEDERMKTIVAGDDPGNIGVKDTSKMSAPSNLNIKELCDPTSKPKASSLPAAGTTTISSNDSNKSSPGLQPHCSTISSMMPSNVMVSPESCSAPPNVNPFQLPKVTSGSPLSSTNSSPSHQYYDISSPKSQAFVGNPFMGVAVSQDAGVGCGETAKVSPLMKPSHYKICNIRQSSLESQKDVSPPYTCSGATVYTYSTPSPENTLTHTLSPSMDSGISSAYYQQQQCSSSFSEGPSPGDASSLQHSPPYGGQSPYEGQSPFGNPSPYSVDSNNGAVYTPSPPQCGQVSTTTFAAESTVYFPSPQNYGVPVDITSPGFCMSGQDFGYTTQTIKQEPVSYDLSYLPSEVQSHPRLQKFEKDDSYVSQAKARYSTVVLHGKQYHSQSHKRPTQEDAAIFGISQWLQQESASVH